ncbi:MAG: response regulator transcription factor [Anaerolineae bacterium]|nr:response regulator transcription factor [Anaerolineae bacterium]
MSSKIRVLIADDHPIVRQGMELVLTTRDDMELVGQAVNGAEAVTFAVQLRPDVVVMDLQMPVKDGLTAIREIKKAEIDTRVLLLTSFPEDEKVIEAVQAGAAGVVLKESSPDRLVEAIRTVYDGDNVLHPAITRQLIHESRKSTVETTDPILTPRERDVLCCLAQGMTNRAIANELDISVRTVTTHVHSILDKLNASNRTQAAIYASDLCP